jgi:ABC-2 type transport system permease protein
MKNLAPLLAIARKDVESYYAKPPLITWGLLLPLVLLLAIYVKDPKGYLDVAPGLIGMTLLFGSTSMAAIVITFEKRTGTLQRLLLAPVSRSTVLLGKSLSATSYGIGTALVLVLVLACGLRMPVACPGALAAGLLLGGWMFALLGLAAAAMVREVFEAMALMNFVRFPLLFVSGVFMPLSAMPDWLLPVAAASPLTYVVELLRWGLLGQTYLAGPWLTLAVTVACCGAAWLIADLLMRRHIYRG